MPLLRLYMDCRGVQATRLAPIRGVLLLPTATQAVSATYCNTAQCVKSGSKVAVFLKKKEFQHKILYGLNANAMLGGNYVRGVNR